MEFELEPKESYYRSYTDKIITGSMIVGTRGMVGSVVSGSNEYRGDNSFNAYSLKKVYPEYRSSFLKGVQLQNTSKVYHDSIMPDFTEIYALNRGYMVAPRYDEVNWCASFSNDPRFKFDSKILKLFLVKGHITGGVNISGNAIGDERWMYDFPFMGRYSSVVKKLDVSNIQQTSIVEEVLVETDTSVYGLVYRKSLPPSSSNKYVVCFAEGDNEEFEMTTYYDRLYSPSVFRVEEESATIVTKNLAGLSSKDLLSSFFGFGVEPISDITYPSFTLATQGPSSKAYGVKIQGWRYGVLNGTPINPRAVFRMGKFGQLRDMLEPRLYTKTYDSRTNTTDSPMKATFVTGSQAFLTASNPLALNLSDSGYYDFEYKVGKPFIEDGSY
jgi:hypothetical protein